MGITWVFPTSNCKFVSAGSVAVFEDSESDLQGSDSDVQGSDSDVHSSDSDVIPTTQSMDLDEVSTSSSMTCPLSISTCRMADRIASVSGKNSSNRGRGRGRLGRGCGVGRGQRLHRETRIIRRGRGRGCSSFVGPSATTVSSGGLATVDVVNGSWVKQEPSSSYYSYSKTPEPTSVVSSETPSALHLFGHFFTDEVWDLLVVETNSYASSVVGKSPAARPWAPVTVPEMKAFLGIIILMGIFKIPRLEMYWSSRNPHISTPGMANIKSRIRFEQIFRCLHLNNNANQIPTGQPSHDHLFKVRKLLDIIVPQFESEYEMHQQCTIDEAMIPFKGRLGFKQYLKDKPTKWGIKVFVLADATNGYVKKIQIYTGKSLVVI